MSQAEIPQPSYGLHKTTKFRNRAQCGTPQDGILAIGMRDGVKLRSLLSGSQPASVMAHVLVSGKLFIWPQAMHRFRPAISTYRLVTLNQVGFHSSGETMRTVASRRSWPSERITSATASCFMCCPAAGPHPPFQPVRQPRPQHCTGSVSVIAWHHPLCRAATDRVMVSC